MRNAPYTYENQGQRTKGLVTDFPTLLRQDYNASLVKDPQVQWKGDWEVG